MTKQADALRLLRPLPPDVQARFMGSSQIRTYAAGETIFDQGEATAAFYLVISGQVKVVRVTPEGYENILCVRGPGDHFCPVSLLDRGPQLGTAVAMTAVTLLWIEKETFRRLCAQSPDLLSAVQGDCLAEVRRLLHRLEVVAFRSVRQRVAHALLTLSRQQPDRSQAHLLRLTQQELGALIGASRESVSRALADLERSGAVEVQRGLVILQDRPLLEQAAGSGSEDPAEV